MADPFFGLELVHVAHLEALQRPADAAVLFVHWTLASSGLQAEHPTQVSSGTVWTGCFIRGLRELWM